MRKSFAVSLVFLLAMSRTASAVSLNSLSQLESEVSHGFQDQAPSDSIELAQILDQNARANNELTLAQTSFDMPSVPKVDTSALSSTEIPKVPSNVPGADGVNKAVTDVQKTGADAVQKNVADAEKMVKGKVDDAKAQAENKMNDLTGQAKDQMNKLVPGSAAATPPPGGIAVNPASIVLRGQWVKTEEDKDFILFDPLDQAYDLTFCDKQTNTITKFEKDQKKDDKDKEK